MATSLILKPYERRKPPGPFRKLIAGLGLVFVSAFYGLMCTILPMQLIVIPLVPILLLAALILWMMPDGGGVNEKFIATGLVWFVGLNVLWPGYVALNAPGLPWITPTRAITFAVVAVAVWNYATSAELRLRIREGLNGVPLARKLFWAFWATTTLSLLLSAEPFASVSKYANNQLYWTMMFALSAWLAMREGFAMRISRVIAWSIIVVAVLAIIESVTGSPIWLNHLPGFLNIDNSMLNRIGEGEARTASGVYRVRGTFGVALYFAEYLAIAFPFVLHFAARSKRLVDFMLLALALVALIYVMVLTDSRSAILGLVLSVVAYGFLTAWRLNRQRPDSIVAGATLFAYPVFAIVLATLIVFWRRLHVMIIGGGQHAASTETRGTQWEMGIPKIITHPFGHGVGRSGLELGYYNPGSENPSVDSYYLTLLLDYGVLGLLFFLTLFAVMIWLGFRANNRARTEEALLAAPITVALLNYVTIKAVASSEINMPIVMILIGCLVGLVARQRQADATVSAECAAAESAGVTDAGATQGWSGTPQPA